MRETSIGYPRLLNARECRVELILVHPEAVVAPGKVAGSLVKIDGESIVHVNRGERTDSCRRPLYTEDRGKLSGSAVPVPGRDHDVVEVDSQSPRPPLAISTTSMSSERVRPDCSTIPSGSTIPDDPYDNRASFRPDTSARIT